MKKQFLLLSALLGALTYGNAQITFADTNFEQALIDVGVDVDRNGEISEEEAESVTFLSINNDDMTNLDGIEYFVNLDRLIAYGQQLNNVDVSQNTKLTDISLYYDVNVTNLDISGCTELTKLDLSYCSLTNIDVSNNEKLTYLSLHENDMTSLDLSDNSDLETLLIGDCKNLELICVNDENNDLVNSAVEGFELTGVTISSDCNATNNFSDLFTLFPNPTTTGNLTISVTDTGLDEGVTIETSSVYDLNNTLWGSLYHGGTTSSAMSFPWLISNTYILQITTSTGEIYTTNFIKQ